MAPLLSAYDLPRFFKIKGAYGGPLAQMEDGSLKYYFDADAVVPHQQFQLQPEKTGRDHMFSIRSCYNNKYLVRKDPDSIFLTMGAAHPNEDPSQWDCTLFEALASGGKPEHALANPDEVPIKLRSVHSQKLVSLAMPVQDEFILGLEMDDEADVLLGMFLSPHFFSFVKCEPPESKLAEHGGPDYVFFPGHTTAGAPVDVSFPGHVVLKCNFSDEYLCLEEDCSQVRVNGKDVWSPRCKFVLERAVTTSHGKQHNLYIIRSAYNNKYWAKVESGLIKAVADKPKEEGHDNTKNSSNAAAEIVKPSLFQPLLVNESDAGGHGKVIQLRLPQSQDFVGYTSSRSRDGSLFVSNSLPALVTQFTVTSLGHFVRLPKHVAFKGDNGKYLAARTFGGKNYLKFDSSDIREPEVAHEIFYTGDFSVGIKTPCVNKFWKADSHNWILVDSDNGNIADSLFEAINIGEHKNTIGLRNVGNKLYCKRFTDSFGVVDCLSANVSSVTIPAVITVDEPVSSREVSNVNFRLFDARIYDQTVKTMVTGDAPNANSKEATVEVKLSYQHKTSSTWNATLSLSVGVEVSFQCGVKFIAEGGLKVSANFQGTYSWGKTVEESSEVETTYVVPVPPNSKVQVRVVATEGKCDIPFSYTVCDTLKNGDQRTYEMYDGVYTGVTTYNFKWETSKPIPLV